MSQSEPRVTDGFERTYNRRCGLECYRETAPASTARENIVNQGVVGISESVSIGSERVSKRVQYSRCQGMGSQEQCSSGTFAGIGCGSGACLAWTGRTARRWPRQGRRQGRRDRNGKAFTKGQK